MTIDARPADTTAPIRPVERPVPLRQSVYDALVELVVEGRLRPGRSGPGQMYLASPLTVAASAVAGYIVEYEPSAERELATTTRVSS